MREDDLVTDGSLRLDNEPDATEVQQSAERVRARRRAATRSHVNELLGKLRRLTEKVSLLTEAARSASKAARDFTARIEALEITSCKYARTVGKACPSLGDRCEICEREAEAEWYKAKVLGPMSYTPDQLSLKCSIEHDAGCTCTEAKMPL